MALERVRDILALGKSYNTAIYAFDATDLDTVYATIQGAERAGKPVIVMLYPTMSAVCPLRVFAEMVKTYAREVKTPVGLHLDHCSDYDFIITAIREGFTSVMADGSLLPFDENVAFTRQVVRTAKIFDVDVEGELGHVGAGSNTGDYGEEDMYTIPDDARRFCEATGVASLAVAIGSAHGVYVKAPKLSIARLKEIDRATDTPLVLHGGSGIPEAQLIEAFASGINKFNIGTEFFALNSQVKRKALDMAEKSKPFAETRYIRERLTQYIADKVSLCRVKL